MTGNLLGILNLERHGKVDLLRHEVQEIRHLKQLDVDRQLAGSIHIPVSQTTSHLQAQTSQDVHPKR